MRRIIQVSSSMVYTDTSLGITSLISALCDDGTLWLHTPGTAEWVRVPDLPQDPEPPAPLEDELSLGDELEDIPF